MHAKVFLHKYLSSVMHLKRLETLGLCVEAALKSKKLSVTHLGRTIKTKGQEKSNIRRSDRLMSNEGLHKERVFIYKAMIDLLVAKGSKPNIIVDESNIPNSTHYVLRAALVTEGRALSLYEEVHPESKQGNARIQKKFLQKLKWLLPEGCKPIIITDAGFHNPWFNAVLRLDWDYVGRIRGIKTFRYLGEKNFIRCQDLFKEASTSCKHIGKIELTQTNRMLTDLYLYQGKKKNRINLNKRGKRRNTKNEKEYSKAGREPWLIVSSLEGKHISKKIVDIYSQRMQIEEGFRDLKSTKYGLSFEEAHSKKIKRIEVLLLIGMLASLIAWMTGYAAEKKGLHYQFQANTVKNKRVLSFFFLGCQVIRKKIEIHLDNLVNELTEKIRCFQIEWESTHND